MNSVFVLPRPTSVCLFCRQGLRHLRQRHSQPQQLSQGQLASWAQSHQGARPRFLSTAPVVQFPASSAAAAVAVSPSTATASSSPPATGPSSTYTRYSLYSEPVPPVKMRPPPPPHPLEPELPTPPSQSKRSAQGVETPRDTAVGTKTRYERTENMRLDASLSAALDPATKPKPTASSLKPKAKRPSKLRVPRKAAMHLTPAAVEQVKSLLEGPEPKLLKVGVRNRGCSGLAYNLEYVEKPGAFDELVEQDGVRVLVDSKALFSIIGSEMDWVEDKLNQRFVFRNPNIKEQCGCGESFMV